MMPGLENFAPAGYDLVVTLLWVAGSALALIALVHWFRTSRTETDRVLGLVGVLVIILFPLLGPIAYLLSVRGREPTPEPRRQPGADDDDARLG